MALQGIEINCTSKLYYIQKRGLIMKRTSPKILDKKKIIIIAAVGLIITFGGVAVLAGSQNDNILSNGNNSQKGSSSKATDTSQVSPENFESHVAPMDASKASNSSETAKSLVYIIEEEKLAHDVYQAMYEKWGSRVFSNIIRSENSHQNEVLLLLQKRNIADPRSASFGVFKNQELQALYNKLVPQGSKSANEAFKVGVAIEELDISDLKIAINALDPADADVKSAYQTLLSGSENHLSAFNRQITR